MIRILGIKELGVIGESSSAAAGIYAANDLGIVMRDFYDPTQLTRWMKQDDCAKLVVMDQLLAKNFVSTRSRKEFVTYDQDDEIHLGNRLRFKFDNPVPVGIPVLRGDYVWRSIISHGMLKVLYSQKDIWGEDSAPWRISGELAKHGIDAFSQSELIASLQLELSLKDLMAWYALRETA